MSNRMDIKSWRKSRNGKAYAIRIGSTWTNDKGVTYLEFDALPLPDEQGRVSCFLEVPRDRDASPSAGASSSTYSHNGDPARMASGGTLPQSGGGKASAREMLQDDVPF
jgi:hypothetical protein